jgi:hypothetical protein
MVVSGAAEHVMRLVTVHEMTVTAAAPSLEFSDSLSSFW